MKKTAIIPTLIITILLVSGAAFAWSGGPGNRNCTALQGYSGPGNRNCTALQGYSGRAMTPQQQQVWMNNRLEKMAIILDLTAQQKGQIKTLFEKKWQDRQSMWAEIQASRKTLREYKQGKQFNESEFLAIAQKHADLKTEMMVQQAKTRQQIFAILTPEQQMKAEKLQGLRSETFAGTGRGMRGCNGYGRGQWRN